MHFVKIEFVGRADPNQKSKVGDDKYRDGEDDAPRGRMIEGRGFGHVIHEMMVSRRCSLGEPVLRVYCIDNGRRPSS